MESNGNTDAVRQPSYWPRYCEKHRQKKAVLEGFPGGRIGRITIICRGDTVNLRWRQNGLRPWECVGNVDDPSVMSKAVLRATELNRELETGRLASSSFREATMCEACQVFTAAKEATPGISGKTIHKYSAELALVIAFAEKTREGRRCRFIHTLDSKWAEDFCSWLDQQIATRNGGPATSKNPERPLNSTLKHDIRRLLASVIDHAVYRSPPLVPLSFRNPMTPALIGREKRYGNCVSDPPVSQADLITVVRVLDAYGLGLLAPLFLFGPRPSELGHVLRSDFNATDGLLHVLSRPESGYWTKGRRDKVWPATDALTACIRPFLANLAGPLFIKRRIFEGKMQPALPSATHESLAREFECRLARETQLRGKSPGKEGIEKISEAIWAAAGAVDARDVLRELERASVKANLPRVPTPRDLRHLFESECEAARLSLGVIRHLLGHAPVRGDALVHYNHAGKALLREQVAILDQRRQPLIDTLLARANDLQALPS